MKKAKCKVWEVSDPNNYWYETFKVYNVDDIKSIFNSFNCSRRPNEDIRDYEFIEFIDE